MRSRHHKTAGRVDRRSTITSAGYVAAMIGALLVSLGVLPASASSPKDQPPVGLGVAGSYGVLAGSGITDTGPTSIVGDIGTFPTPSETGVVSITLDGTNEDGDAVTQQAKNDLVTAYNNASGRSPVTDVPVELGGRTLLPGVYAGGELGLTGALTLDGGGDPNAMFVFKAASTLITASDSQVRLINGAQACNIVWVVASSATFGAGTQFVGDVLAHTSITATTRATFHGRLLARVGAVTLDANTITPAACSTAVAPPSPAPSASVSGSAKPTPTPVRTAPPVPSPTSTHVGVIPPGVPAPHPSSPRPSTVSRTPTSTATPVRSSTPTPGTTTTHGPRGRTPQRNTVKLPFTGAPVGEMTEIGLALIAVGAAAIVATRRRGWTALTSHGGVPGP